MTDVNVVVRHAEAGDVSAIVELLGELFAQDAAAQPRLFRAASESALVAFVRAELEKDRAR